mmetsp:Transcript_48852/g.88324  ORF Transcript_48852/g.88324 Transcript_48852/m.88324 type:complete len:200 (+) Transcript_48852:2-601(+)
MIGGLASRILMTEDGKGWDGHPYLFTAFAVDVACVSGFNMVYIITCAMVYFNVYRILSKTSSTQKTINTRLLAFWKEFETLRAVARDLFSLSIPMFLVALGLQGWVMMPCPARHIVGPFLFFFAVVSVIIIRQALAFTEVYLCGAACKAGDLCYRRFVAQGHACSRRLMCVDVEDMEKVITPGRVQVKQCRPYPGALLG